MDQSCAAESACKIREIRRAQRADGPAAIMAIGTANPPNVIDQGNFPDFYFRMTSSEDKQELKEKLKLICDRTTVKNRYAHLTEEIVEQNPNLRNPAAPSLETRLRIMIEAVPNLGKEAAAKALKEWGQPKSMITHLVFCSGAGVDMPGADYQLVKLLGLSPSVKRVMLYHLGCYGGGTVLRVAKDLAENNRGARVLVVNVEITTVSAFRAPDEAHLDSLVGQALFGDGAAALVVGADPIQGVEKPIFEMAIAAQTLLPESEGKIGGQLKESGLAIPPAPGRPQDHLQEHRGRPDGRVQAVGRLGLELLVLGGAPRRSGHPQPRGDEAEAEAGEAAGDEARAARVREHVERHRVLCAGRDEEAVSDGGVGDYRPGAGVGSALRTRTGDHRGDCGAPQRASVTPPSNLGAVVRLHI
ncbi:hypothetical protein MUK42_10135 [Musa troglodytarum]|uniref:Chalcone/stilbene synthase N-terminal domain-containing protein n=1 Tax=Musa troglodytarum TaxID=320322 RepID=A0A9E7EDX4_9LILI|nr:hypothetical protein MUK42_10135 [Musa troglodytarum]